MTAERPLYQPDRPWEILIVDDEPDILSALTSTLQYTLGQVEILTATSGAQALEILDQEHVDLIITDYRMPGMDGLEFLEQARPRCGHAARLILTAYPAMRLAIKALNEQDICRFLTKPPEPERFIETVRKCLMEHAREHSRQQAVAQALDEGRRRRHDQADPSVA